MRGIDYTAQEHFFIGTSEAALGSDKPSIPFHFGSGENRFSIAELNRQRIQEKYFHSFLVKSITKDKNAVMGLDILNLRGETEKPPSVFILNRETKELTPAPELTKKVYDHVAEWSREEVDDPRMRQVLESLLNKRPDREKEIEGVSIESREGMKNV